MKNVIVLFYLIGFYANSQQQYTEAMNPSGMSRGVYYQSGPGANNTLNWTYPYGTKLTVMDSPYRNFELLTVNYPFGKLKLRQWDAANSVWAGWRDILIANEDGKIGFGIENPESKLEVLSEIRINAFNTRGNAILKLDRGSDGKDRAIISYGESGIYKWHSGLLYAGGWTTPDYYISRHSQIRDGNGTYIHEPEFTIKTNGSVGIGTSVPDAKLTVKGNIHAEEVKVDLSVPAPDYVFKEDYDLRTLEETQKYITIHGHLPNIPSAKEMEENGVDLGVMNMKLLEKIEELTLYTIEQKDDIQVLKNQIKQVLLQLNNE